MGRLKWASLVFACAALSLAVGAGAFTSVSADRGVEVSVVDDDEAMLGIETAGGGDTVKSDNNPETQPVMTFHNRFGEDIELDVTVSERDGKPKLKSSRLDPASGELGSGDPATLYAKINCNNGDPPPSEDWSVTIEADGETVSVETTETITVECTGDGNKNKTSEES
jgi:hypothetical protein